MPKVSVIIPTYNAAQYIRQAVESALHQTYTDIEVIVVDDGSTDNTAQVLDPYLNQIHYIYQSNQERAVARNRGIGAASGDYIAFLDADDLWLPNKTSLQVACLDAKPNVGLVYSQALRIDQAGQAVGGQYSVFPRQGLYGSDVFPHLVLGNVIPALTVMTRRSLLEELGAFDVSLRYPEDWELWLRITMHTSTCFIPEVLAHYRVQNCNWAKRVDGQDLQNALVYVVEKVFAIHPYRDALKDIYRAAMAEAYWQGALIDYAVGKYDDGSKRLLLARSYESEAYMEPAARFIDRVVYAAESLYEIATPLEEALSYLDRIYSHLPSQMHRLSRSRRRAKARLCAGRMFRGYETRNWPTIPGVALRAAWYDPTWLRSKGFRSILVHSLLHV